MQNKDHIHTIQKLEFTFNDEKIILNFFSQIFDFIEYEFDYFFTITKHSLCQEDVSAVSNMLYKQLSYSDIKNEDKMEELKKEAIDSVVDETSDKHAKLITEVFLDSLIFKFKNM